MYPETSARGSGAIVKIGDGIQDCPRFVECVKHSIQDYAAWLEDYFAGKARYHACGYMLTRQVALCSRSGYEECKTEVINAD